MSIPDSTIAAPKVCTKCGQPFPATPEFFYFRKDNKQFRAECKDCVRSRARDWHHTNVERVHVRQSVWRMANPEKKAAAYAAWRMANLERCRTYAAAWQRANPDKVVAIRHRHRALESGASGTHTADDIKRIYAEQRGLCVYCDCDLAEAGFHVDHVVPLFKGGGNNPENLACACPSCNRSKHTKLLSEWKETR